MQDLIVNKLLILYILHKLDILVFRFNYKIILIFTKTRCTKEKKLDRFCGFELTIIAWFKRTRPIQTDLNDLDCFNNIFK